MNEKYVNREISWLDFNYRVLDQAYDLNNPLAERFKFLAITADNLDEFYRIRIAGLDQSLEERISNKQTALTDSREKLNSVKKYATVQIDKTYKAHHDLVKKMSDVNKFLKSFSSLIIEEKQYFIRTFIEDLKEDLVLKEFNLKNLELVNNNTINVVCSDRKNENKRYLVALNTKERVLVNEYNDSFVLSEDFLINNLDKLYPKKDLAYLASFRILRNADLKFPITSEEKYLVNLEDALVKRELSEVIRLDISNIKDEDILFILKNTYSLIEKDVSILDGPVDLKFWFEVYEKKIMDDRYYYPHQPPIEMKNLSKENILETINKRDRLVYHPYQSYNSFINFLEACVNDPYVKSIKQTFYRLCDNSSVIDLLIKAAKLGKEVTVFIELRARFDEKRNLKYYQALTNAGCKVLVYFDKKVHAKVCLITKEKNGILTSYAHIGTGNYNLVTANIYSDLSLFTRDDNICKEISDFFDYLTKNTQKEFSKLLVSPLNLRDEFLDLIKQEELNVKAGKRGLIIAKMNSLVNSDIIDALYKASEAGVVIKLIVRGICSLNPNYKPAKNIEVISIVGRYLEHTRIYYFYNNNQELFFISSADWMTRNLERRVEIAVKVEDEKAKNLLKTILSLNLEDNLKARKMIKPNKYIPKPVLAEKLNSQDILYNKFIKENQNAKTCNN